MNKLDGEINTELFRGDHDGLNQFLDIVLDVIVAQYVLCAELMQTEQKLHEREVSIGIVLSFLMTSLLKKFGGGRLFYTAETATDCVRRGSDI